MDQGVKKIPNNNNNQVGYITGSFPAFLFGGDIFQVFIVIIAVLILISGVSAIYRKRQSSKKADERLSSLKREFNTVKQESFNESEGDWIGDRLNDDDPDMEDMIPVSKR